MLKDVILDFIKREEIIAKDPEYRKSRAFPENCYMIDDGVMLCYPRGSGDSRYPYSCDGFTLWAHSSGNISLNESTFYYILPSAEGKQPYCAFFGGIADGQGYTPVSVTGAAHLPRDNVKRFTVFTPAAVYYIAVVKNTAYFLRAFVSADKKAVFTVGAINTGKTRVKTYLSAYFNCLCMHSVGESVETKWFKQCSTTDSGFLFESVENITRTKKLFDYGVINRSVNAEVEYCEHTCSRADYAGGVNETLNCAEPLFTGHFSACKKICKFGDTAAAGDIYAVNLDGGAVAAIDYVLGSHFDEAEARAAVHALPGCYAEDRLCEVTKIKDILNDANALKIRFGEFANGELNGTAFTAFINNVIRQVNFAALAKNSGVSLLGVRDVVQQLEAALIWTPEKCRAKFIELLGFIDPCGRPPRQYSLPDGGALPVLDTRAFIDQGVWIISAIYSYLAYTDDYSILDEECGYCKFAGGTVAHTDERNTVAEHISRIADYLINNIDGETGCLRALYGDWNDALDGLGVSKTPGMDYGTGVSVMASLQLYQNLKELLHIIDVYGDRFGNRARYMRTLEVLKKGLSENAVVSDGEKRRIVHGWGDKRSYLVGSFRDADGNSRDGLTANAFWIISGMYLNDKSIKSAVMDSFSRLDSKYGLKTFEPYFARDAVGVGRIVDLPKGTAENAAVYVHAALFGIWALFKMGESEEAWKQLYKLLPLTHSLITTTPFVMSNSYSYNEELGLDGESMSDWFTGSANALIKAVVRYVFGIMPDLGGVAISPPMYMPTDSASISVTVKGRRITLDYTKSGGGKRAFTVDGIAVKAEADPSSGTPMIYIKTSDLKNGSVIEVKD